MTPEEEIKIKTDFIWKLIERFQEDRMMNDDCIDRETWSDQVLSYNDVECCLYEVLEDIDPSKTLLPNTETK